VEPDRERRHGPRSAYGVGGAGARDHQARRRENPRAMRDLDRLIDLVREAEIVRCDDQAVGAQCAGSLWARRKAKNSTPSRSRRFIICGLLIISPTIEAIFGTRK
jgi:hypothetical protein